MAQNPSDLTAKAAEVLERQKAIQEAKAEQTAATQQKPTAPQQQPLSRVSVPKFSEAARDAAYGAAPDEASMAAAGAQTTDAMTPEVPEEFNLEAEPVDNAPSAPVVQESGDETLITSAPAEPVKLDKEDETIILSSTAKAAMPNMPADAQNDFLAGILPQIKDYQKRLVLDEGMTPDEARSAAESRIRRQAQAANDDYTQKNPDAVILNIDKSQESQLDIDPDTRAKMLAARSIKLVMIESRELETLKIKELPSDKPRVRMNHIRDLAGALSNYSVPLPSLGDYATFSGAQSYEMASCTRMEDDSYMDWIEKKATLCYKHFLRSTLRSRIGDDGEPMSYDEFCNWYHFDDVDMGVFAIVVASSMEETNTTYQCQVKSCQQLYPMTYNAKSLIDLSEVPDVVKARIEAIDEARAYPSKMQAVQDEATGNLRFKSEFTGNVYEMYSPTIAEVRDRMERCSDAMALSDLGNLTTFIYMRKIYVYDSGSDDYIMIDMIENPEDGLEVIGMMHEIDLELCNKVVDLNKYHPEFKIKVKCPHCKHEGVDRLNIDSLVFLHARATSVEIR